MTISNGVTTKLFFVLFLVFFVLSLLLFTKNAVNAQADLSITNASISFSEERFLEDNMIRIYVRVWNTSDIDAHGFVKIYLNDSQIGDAQPISLKTGTYDDIFLDWLANAGVYSIKAELVDILPEDINAGNNIVLMEGLFVDLDTDQDGIGNKEDLDDDNDGLSDEDEIIAGTNPLQSDTDNDGVDDISDVFPLDPTEWSNNDGDNLGDNADPDDDNDGLTDEEEHLLGTDPFNHDTDRDGVKDSLDVFPLNPDEWADSDNDGIGDNSDLEDNRIKVQEPDSSVMGGTEEPPLLDYFGDSKGKDDLFSEKLLSKDNKPYASAKIVLSIIVFLSALAMVYAIVKIERKKKF
ncbi:hypothetical protein J7L24_01320 [bacterium]|nr:hypothetical protein [bacterium]